ncbi:hypothetical protein BDP27DRAFT_905502 [Rhodocollybia butyracea]|uniref:Uncharacterized protein n=1 Tax=Rhodocollybia butyracea TaxID=206335 RepID=A0A9P5U650_9AGAR|nr:hypothetical protein BDP27DRAFT_905502 [Rhodocollybia butyracea]
MSRKLVLLNEAQVERVKDIARACSLDVETSTIEDLHSADPLIECVNCSSPNERFFMRWPQAVCHVSHHVLVINSFGKETENIVAQEPTLPNLRFACCSYCHCGSDGFRGSLRSHLITVHKDVVNVDQLPTLNGDGDYRNLLNPRLFNRKDWYWNPCFALDKLGLVWRYTPSPSEPSAVEATSRLL